jgi:hypothetical protein
MKYIVKDNAGGFLSDLAQDKWGTTTVCTITRAMRFPSRDAARAAARKARRICMGWDYTSLRVVRPWPRARFQECRITEY